MRDELPEIMYPSQREPLPDWVPPDYKPTHDGSAFRVKAGSFKFTSLFTTYKPRVRILLNVWFAVLSGIIYLQHTDLFPEHVPGEPQQAFFTFLLFVVTLVLSIVLAPKPNVENARPAGLGDFNFPTSTSGRHMPLFWGTVRFDGPNVTWYGDLKQKPIEREVGGAFNSETQIIGYKYFVGIQYAWSYEEVDSLQRFWIGDELVHTGQITHEQTIDVSEPKMFGGDDLGAGGYIGTFRWHMGQDPQAISSYLSAFIAHSGDTPRYNNLCYCVLEQGYIGNREQVTHPKAELRRIPNGLALGSPATINGNDANPMNVIYEALTNTDWGESVSPADIDTSSFTAAATTLSNEGNGFSFILDSQRESGDLVSEIERQCEGFLVFDRVSRKFKFNLIRAGASVFGTIDEGNTISFDRFSRQGWGETQNQVRVKFDVRANEYKEDYAVAMDGANSRIVGANKAVEIRYPGVKDPDLANDIAWRDLSVLSAPLAKARVVVNREFTLINPGDLVNLTNVGLGITNIGMRVIKVNLTEIRNGRITLDLIEDVFATRAGAFAAPGGTGWVSPSQQVVDIPTDDLTVFEAPRKFILLDQSSYQGVERRVFAAAVSQGRGEISFDILGAGATVGRVFGYMLKGTLDAAVLIGATTNIDVVPETGEQQEMIDAFQSATDNQRGTLLANLILVNGEFMSVGSVAANGNNVRLSNVARGFLDTAAADHAMGDDVYLIFMFGGTTTSAFTGSSISIELLPESRFDKLTAAEATAHSVTLTDRARQPYLPSKLNVNAAAYPETGVELDTSYAAGEDSNGLAFTWTQRDFETTDELASYNGTNLPSDFPSKNTTLYRVITKVDPDGTPVTVEDTGFVTATGGHDVSRTAILNAAGGVPTRMRVEITARHTVDGTTYDSLQTLAHDFDVQSTQLDSGDTNWGTLDDTVISGVFTATSTGSHSLSIGSNVLSSGVVEGRVNGGAFATIISTGTTSGSVSLNATDTLEIRHTESGSGTTLTICLLNAPGGDNVEAYGVLRI